MNVGSSQPDPIGGVASATCSRPANELANRWPFCVVARWLYSSNRGRLESWLRAWGAQVIRAQILRAGLGLDSLGAVWASGLLNGPLAGP